MTAPPARGALASGSVQVMPAAGSPDSNQEAPLRGHTLQEAAALLGVSVNTLRRRLEAGEIRGERVSRPQGYVWRVYLAPATQEAGQPAASTLQQPPGLQRAEAMSGFLVPLLEQAMRPLVEELATTRQQLTTQAEELGRLRLELELTRAELGALQAPARQESPQTAVSEASAPRPSSESIDATRRPWWRRVWGFSAT